MNLPPAVFRSICVFAGAAALNPLIAWISALLFTPAFSGGPFQRGVLQNESLFWTHSVYRAPAMTYHSSYWSYRREETRINLVQGEVIGYHPNDIAPAWTSIIDTIGSRSIPGPLVDYVVDARGWPMQSLYSISVLDTAPGGWQTSLGILWREATNGSFPRLLPYGIRTGPFLVNTLVYAAAVVLILTLMRSLCARARRVRGYCPKCKYDLRSNIDTGCPECGWNRPEVKMSGG